ncbi:RibD family protein [Brevundimonas aveniformis]|uniref:RibD family protein n=1 Tax=Brevundimonas aveniformis TaxID=370977 RepID=UPI00041D6B32|nr:RibD family protein [Brevundimonas aveniformis]
MRPSVTLKLATSLDGRIAMASGESQWITGDAARAQGHRLRADHDAILVGVETILADDPSLTVRIDGVETEKQPLRVILDSRLRTPSLAEAAKLGSLILTGEDPRPIRRAQIERVDVGEDGRPTVEAVLAALGKRHVRSVLIEGGGQVAASFLKAGLVDQIEWFRSAILLGSEGRPCVGALELAHLSDAPRLERVAVVALGPDLWERYQRVR